MSVSSIFIWVINAPEKTDDIGLSWEAALGGGRSNIAFCPAIENDSRLFRASKNIVLSETTT